MQGRDWVCKVLCDGKHDQDSYIIGIGFAILEFEHYILILLSKCDVDFFKMEISKR